MIYACVNFMQYSITNRLWIRSYHIRLIKISYIVHIKSVQPYFVLFEEGGGWRPEGKNTNYGEWEFLN